MRKPSGSNKPAAKRFQESFCNLSSIPETIHTSPFQVESAARPSEKKSIATKRSHDCHGFFSGAVNVSTTYGPPNPNRPRVMIASGQSGGPPAQKSLGFEPFPDIEKVIGSVRGGISLCPTSIKGLSPAST